MHSFSSLFPQLPPVQRIKLDQAVFPVEFLRVHPHDSAKRTDKIIVADGLRMTFTFVLPTEQLNALPLRYRHRNHTISPSAAATSVVTTNSVRRLNRRGQGSQGKKAITTHNVTTNQSGAIRSPS
jgi:hypothetical protein